MSTTVTRQGAGARAPAPEADIPLRERAFATLKQRILEGAIPPGTVLSEGRVAVDLGISRTPVREALARLTHEGLAQRFNGRGVIVLELSAKALLDVIEVQACLEQFAITRLLEDGRPLDVADLRREVEQQRQAIEAGDRRLFLEHDRQMHLSIVDRTDNSKLTLMMQNASDLLMYAGYRALRDVERLRETLTEHEALIDAIAMGDLQGALAASGKHIRGAKRRLLG
jgi:DNA-binding GntR family transcriptional regulator